MKDIQGYEGLYAITKDGQVWSYKSNRFLKPSTTNGEGTYLKVSLSKEGKVSKRYIHRLVAEAFIPNPENKPEVNHIDENKQNNCVSNLEWVTEKENANHGTRTQRVTAKISKPVRCVELDKVFPSQREAARQLDLSQGNITRACQNSARTVGGYHWEYVS